MNAYMSVKLFNFQHLKQQHDEFECECAIIQKPQIIKTNRYRHSNTHTYKFTN